MDEKTKSLIALALTSVCSGDKDGAELMFQTLLESVKTEQICKGLESYITEHARELNFKALSLQAGRMMESDGRPELQNIGTFLKDLLQKHHFSVDLS